MSVLINLLAQRAQDLRCELVFPEGDDVRVQRAAQMLRDNTNLRPTLLTPGSFAVSAADVAALAAHRAKSGMGVEEARKVLQEPLQYALWKTRQGDFDGCVAGAVYATADVVRGVIRLIGTAVKGAKLSSAMLMEMHDQAYVFADCGLTPDPDARALARIAVDACATARALGLDPKVAMLSYATYDSAEGPLVEKIREATQVAQALLDVPVSGPLQFDAAVNAQIGARKCPGDVVAGQANVLLFPDLNAGNIAYKAVQQASGGVAIGPLLQGAARAVNDLSRGASAEDIYATALVTALQAQ